MTSNSKTKPLDQKAVAPEPLTKRTSEPGHSKIRGEISIGLTGIVNEPSEKPNQSRAVITMKLHLILKTLMESKKQSARKAAKACGVPLTTFTGYLKPNKKQLDPGHLMAIAEYYQVTVDYLLGRPDAIKFEQIPTKKIFSKWVRLTIEDFDDGTTSVIFKNEEGKND